MSPNEKMSAEERRDSIVQAATRLFGRQGFEGTTTKEIAEAAGVSEALLFKHFPSKENLYGEMQSSCVQDSGIVSAIGQLKPSVESLILIVYSMVMKIILGPNLEKERHEAFKRLMIYSILEGSNFARDFLKARFGEWVGVIDRSMQAAEASGDLVPSPHQSRNALWLVHHLAIGVSIFHLQKKPVVDYGESKDALALQALWFALRGIGVRDEVIAKFLTPENLKKYAALLAEAHSQK